MKIGFIGLGNMGGSLARLVAQDDRYRDGMLLANRSQEKAEKLAAEAGGQPASNAQVFAQADVVFLGVKPAQYAALLADYETVLKKREPLLLVSMAAGLPLATLEKLTPKQHRWIRIMPNTPVAVGEGVITYALSELAGQAD
ncbi:NAD(P)-binding domain-containing protein, partial [Streptococcus sp. DD11]|uniref:pyrroline-5-carboxylate reductase family protein n=1 Tax=Streptococcus sp. DD11 TaxID=1777879 RepID=UPI001F4A029A